MEMAHHLSVVPNQPVDLEAQLSRAEAELSQKEAQLAAERERLFSKAMELSARGVNVPDLPVEAIRQSALNARRAAVDARTRAAEELGRVLKAGAAQISSIAAQLAMQQQAAAAQREQAAREQAQREQTAREQAAREQARQKPGPDNRKSTRVAMQAAIDFGSDTNFYSGFSTNISEGGVFIATVKFLPHGTPVDLSFSLPGGQKITAHAVVRWTREINDKTPEIMPGIGVQFVDLPDEAAKAIQRFVKERDPMFFPD